MNAESPRQSSFLCAPWNRIPIAPWLFSLLVLAILTAARFYAVYGPPQARILFLIHFLAMWTLPFILLSAQGRREIGLRKQGNSPSALVLSALAGASASATNSKLPSCAPPCLSPRPLRPSFSPP
jgi:hypothetical protein